jgi:hypothetical protein
VPYKPHSALGRPIIIPRGVADSEGRRGYLANDVAAGISALDLTTGELLWTTDAATQPVFVAESRLAALKRESQSANVLLVIMLNVDGQGKVALVSEPIVLPDWMVVTTAPSEDFSFEVWGDANELRLEWEAHARYRGGAAPSLQIQQQATHDAAGVARVNLKRGRVEMLPPEEQVIRQFQKRLEEVETASFKRGTKWFSAPEIVGEKIAALIFKDGEEPALMLQTWRLPAVEEETAVAVGKGRGLVPEVTPDGQIYRTDNGTDDNPRWKRIGHAAPNPLSVGLYCTRITIDSNDHETVYVTFGGYVRDNIWKTTDGGGKWSNIGASLPEAPVHSLTIHPRKSRFLYVGTEVGIFASEDGGATWSPTSEGPTNCSVYELFWMGETLVCATHGRGMFQIDLSGA